MLKELVVRLLWSTPVLRISGAGSVQRLDITRVAVGSDGWVADTIFRVTTLVIVLQATGVNACELYTNNVKHFSKLEMIRPHC